MAFFDTANEKESSGFQPAEPGVYQAMILGMTYKATKAGTGHYLAGTFLITGARHDGMKIFHNFNIDNQNETAQRIGRGQFKQLLTALGVTKALETPEEAEAICQDRYLTLKLDVEKDRRDDKLRNVVKAFMPASGAPTAPTKSFTDDTIPF